MLLHCELALGLGLFFFVKSWTEYHFAILLHRLSKRGSVTSNGAECASLQKATGMKCHGSQRYMTIGTCQKECNWNPLLSFARCNVQLKFELALKVKVLITKVWREVTLCIFYETSKIKEYFLKNKGKYSLYSIWNMWNKKVFFWYLMKKINILLTLRIF